MPLTDLISVIPPDGDTEEAEDIFAFAAGLIFPDDTRNMHGDDRSVIVYKSSRFGDIELRNADPQSEDERRLFAHYLWNAGIKMAELISEETEDGRWSVKDKRVLELGAGVRDDLYDG
jgi:predicted nicotinamide N-methyase